MTGLLTGFEVRVPDIGDFSDVPVVELLVAAGDRIAEEDPLVTLESDKATMEVPSPISGVVQEVKVALGDRVSEGSLIVVVLPHEPAPAEPARPEAPAAEEPAPSAAALPHAGPGARRLGRVLGVELSTVAGSGRKGRITKDDVQRANDATHPPAVPKPDDEVERLPLTRIQKLSGANLARNWAAIPHVTHHDEADITELEAFRKRTNAEQSEAKVTMVALLVKAVVASLKAFPIVNSSLDGDDLILKRRYNIGFAADTPNGLVVPVIKDADTKGILQIAQALTDLSSKARAGKLGPADMAGATFTISSLGGIGGTGFTPIVNAPEVAILGVARSAFKPVWDGSEFVPRLLIPLSFSYDHRVIDGALAARFVAHLVDQLTDLRRVLL